MTALVMVKNPYQDRIFMSQAKHKTIQGEDGAVLLMLLFFCIAFLIVIGVMINSSIAATAQRQLKTIVLSTADMVAYNYLLHCGPCSAPAADSNFCLNSVKQSEWDGRCLNAGQLAFSAALLEPDTTVPPVNNPAQAKPDRASDFVGLNKLIAGSNEAAPNLQVSIGYMQGDSFQALESTANPEDVSWPLRLNAALAADTSRIAAFQVSALDNEQSQITAFFAQFLGTQSTQISHTAIVGLLTERSLSQCSDCELARIFIIQ